MLKIPKTLTTLHYSVIEKTRKLKLILQRSFKQSSLHHQKWELWIVRHKHAGALAVLQPKRSPPSND